jgi:HicB-like protein involved in pilus formation
MEMSEYVATLRRELATITRFADEDVTRAAEMLTEAMESSVRLTLLEVLSAAAAEITTRLDDAVIEVRLAGGNPDFVVTMTADEPADQPRESAAPGDAAGSDDMARVTLRIAEPLKARVDAAASAAGVSVNTWLIRTISQALDGSGGRGSRTRTSPGVGQRFTGYARG